MTAVKIAYHYRDRYSSLTLRTDSLNLIHFVAHWEDLWGRAGWGKIREDIHVFGLQFGWDKYMAGQMKVYEADFDELFEAIFRIKEKKKDKETSFKVFWQKVRAHSNEPGNDTSDALSKLGRKLPYDNSQLYESVKGTLNLAPGLQLDLSEEGKANMNNSFRPDLAHLIELLHVPFHIPIKSILALFKGHAFSVDVKNTDRGVIKDVVLRVTEEAFTALMMRRKLSLDKFITVTVNPTITQCSRCLKLGDHYFKFCNAGKVRCGNCAQAGHGWKNCTRVPVSSFSSSLLTGNGLAQVQDVCANCLDGGLPSGHSVFSSQCPLRQKIQEKIAGDAIRKAAKGGHHLTSAMFGSQQNAAFFNDGQKFGA